MMQNKFETFVMSVRDLYGSLITGRFLVSGAAVLYMASTNDFDLLAIREDVRSYVLECIQTVDGKVWTCYSSNGGFII